MYGRIIQDLQTSVPHFNDRSPLNPIEWLTIWQSLDKFTKQTSKVEDQSTYNEILTFLSNDVKTLQNWPNYKHYAQGVDTIAIIDTNRCDVERRLQQRGHKSDVERSELPFYVSFQNAFYKLRYENSCVDLAEFYDCGDETTLRRIQMVLAKFLEYSLMVKGDYYIMNWKKKT